MELTTIVDMSSLEEIRYLALAQKEYDHIKPVRRTVKFGHGFFGYFFTLARFDVIGNKKSWS